MEDLKKYEVAILDYLHSYAQAYADDPSGIETFVVADREHHHYQLMRVGWNRDRYFHYCLIHIDIKNEKVWIRLNETEEMVGDELVERGIPKSDIVLGFQHEELRPYTGFATS